MSPPACSFCELWRRENAIGAAPPKEGEEGAAAKKKELPLKPERKIEFTTDEAEKAMLAKSVESVLGLIQACKDIDPSLA